MPTLTINDESMAGRVLHAWELPIEAETITIGNLIRERVTHEVGSYNAKPLQPFKGLVQPIGAEMHLNGYLLKARRKLDPEAQTYRALHAFQENGFFILVIDRPMLCFP